jgi:hypothetical protein
MPGGWVGLDVYTRESAIAIFDQKRGADDEAGVRGFA